MKCCDHIVMCGEVFLFDDVYIFNGGMQNKLALYMYGLCSNREKLKIILNVHGVATYIICSYINQIVLDHAKQFSKIMTDC